MPGCGFSLQQAVAVLAGDTPWFCSLAARCLPQDNKLAEEIGFVNMKCVIRAPGCISKYMPCLLEKEFLSPHVTGV